MINENQSKYPWIIIEGVDYSGKSMLARELSIAINGLTIRSIPKELSKVREAVEQYCDTESRYNFFIAASFYTYALVQNTLLKNGPVITDRWMFSTNIHHKLLGVPDEKLIAQKMIPRSKFMYFTTVSYETWLTRKQERNEWGVDDDKIDKHFILEMNEYLSDNGLVEINTNLMSPNKSVRFIISDIEKKSKSKKH